MSTSRLFCFGLGFTGVALARQLLQQGWQVGGTCRTAEGCAELGSLGIEARVFDGSGPLDGVAEALAATTHLLSTVPPGVAGDPVLRWHGGKIADLQARPVWTGYLSTVGVYGDHGGGWVDERTPVTPAGIRGQRRVEAERQWQEKTAGQVHVFRLPGIYGPGRNALEQLRAGKARRLVRKGQVFNRIHVDDLVQALLASMNRPGPAPGAPDRIFNVCDDLPAPPQDVVTHAAALLDMEPPPVEDFGTATLSPMARSFYGECKRVRNQRLKTGLGVELAYPTYREGLQAIFRLLAGPESVS